MIIEAKTSSDRHRAQTVFRTALEIGIACFAFTDASTSASHPSSSSEATAGPASPTGPGQCTGTDSAAASRSQGPAPSREADHPKPAIPLTSEHFEMFLEGDILDDETACIACMSRVRETIILPCGHLVLCSACSVGITCCPMCRTAIVEFICLA